MHPTVVINVVGLTPALIGERTPNLRAFCEERHSRTLKPILPAVTCSVQSSMLTGLAPGGPEGHGVVGNGWYNREYNEVHFWKQSNALVHGEKVWETAKRRDPAFTCANMFWWYNMYSSADYSVTPRPMYKADGRKIPDIYSNPPELRDLLQSRLGRFPLFHFWGPMAGIASSEWIAEASKIVIDKHDPALTLIYLPHLDYDLQRYGPDSANAHAAAEDIDEVVGDLITFLREKNRRVIILSEYGIEPVSDSVHVNRLLREDGAIQVREEQGLEGLDCGACEAFAVADHQIAHVYVRNPEKIERYAAFLRNANGVELALTRQDQADFGIDHERAGDIVLLAERGRWFSYDYWLDDEKAPDFARTVDIHRKPGYDPLELFIDPQIKAAKMKVAAKIARMKLGFRTLMNVIPLDTRLVRGSHGRIDLPRDNSPILISDQPINDDRDELPCTAVRDVILESLFNSG